MPHVTLILPLLLLFLHPQDAPRFEAQVLDENVAIGYGLAIGDVDGDKKPDILLADKKQFVWYRNGDWKRFVMVDDLTASDNVCIAARDIDGDGKVEVAVGAQWNPSETLDTIRSGSVHYLVRPDDPAAKWTPVKLHHEPVIHRMRWVKAAENKYHLVVLPLHGRGNKGGVGNGVKIFAYEKPADPRTPWKLRLLDETMHLTHNLDVVPLGKTEMVLVGGKEGIKAFSFRGNQWTSASDGMVTGQSFGEVRAGGNQFIAGIQPMHGHELVVYSAANGNRIDFNREAALNRTVLTSGFNQGHALAAADLTGSGDLQIVAGWREPDRDGKVGVKIFVREGNTGRAQWRGYWVDDNGMACEDLQVADLNGDGKPDIIAAGRATHNLKIYWNRN
jgi:hypothetical protein